MVFMASCLLWILAGNAHAQDGTARASSTGVSTDDCIFLYETKLPGLPKNFVQTAILNSCVDGVCVEHVTEEGQTRCHYARGATLTLACERSVKAARAAVSKQLHKGYKRIQVGADLAGIVYSSKIAAVIMAFHKNVILFNMGASSDDNPNPTWPGVKQDVITGARNLTKYLRRSNVNC
jgi:hypothetical protein